jgi:hypothetical protein
MIHQHKTNFATMALAVTLVAQPIKSEATEIEALLYAATEVNEAGDGRTVESGVTIRALINGGYLAAKPNARLDYSDYRRMQKPLDFLGAKLVAVEEQYMTTYVGCCVNHGIGLVFENSAGSPLIAKLATANSCKYSEDDYGLQTALEASGLSGQGGQFAYLFCGLNQLQE